VISSVKYPYDDTVVLVTGAGDGIGRAVAQAFAEQGARVVGLGRHVETVTDALSGFDADRMLALQADVSSRSDVDGLFYVLQTTVPHLKASGGNVVAISSVSGIRGDWGQFAYNATKGAGVTMLQSLALDLGPEGVRVNMVAPALTVTRITEGVTKTPGFDEALRSRVTLGRPGQPEDVARAVLFLASPDAAYITGALLPVDGGTTAATGQIH
jgi:meso-butanediol dehydrogenase/(S,S)-butanediol dehydrogenase/diacetyl reductase